jgi:hypothetical protein
MYLLDQIDGEIEYFIDDFMSDEIMVKFVVQNMENDQELVEDVVLDHYLLFSSSSRTAVVHSVNEGVFKKELSYRILQWLKNFLDTNKG